MIAFYADTSAVVGAYFADEPDHAALAALLFDGEEPVVTSELTSVEFASAVAAATREHRFAYPEVLRDRFTQDCGDDGPLTVLRFDPEAVFPLAGRLVGAHALRTLDALHLAVALSTAARIADEVVMLTRDARQAAAAKELGLQVR